MIDKLLESSLRFNKGLVLLAGIFLIAFLGTTDYLTGSELSFSVFYLIPITVVTLLGSRTQGMIVSLVCATTWVLADIMGGAHYSHVLIPFWNGIVRLGYYILHTWLLSALKASIHREKDKSMHDPLTGAANWRFFEEYSNREITRARREKKPVTLVYFDLDNFKSINDILGHDAGDEILQTICQIIISQARPSDLLARLGGDEFALLMPDTDIEGAKTGIKRLYDHVFAEMRTRRCSVTLSIGAVTYTSLPSSIGIMIKRADEIMYAVKNGGKNNFKIEEWPPPGNMPGSA
jgi:diguanylate cyclase (GGDEF)-like protein